MLTVLLLALLCAAAAVALVWALQKWSRICR